MKANRVLVACTLLFWKRAVPGLVLLVLALVVFAALPLAAQDGATCGIAVTPDGAYRDLGPCPNQNTQRSQPVYHQWAAIAISKARLRTFTAWRAQTKEAAEKNAFNLCARNAHDCAVVVSGPQCVAFAVSTTSKAYGFGSASSYIGADHYAISRCGGFGGVNCHVTADPCADDGPVNQPYISMAPNK
jgi:hypothetical protein